MPGTIQAMRCQLVDPLTYVRFEQRTPLDCPTPSPIIPPSLSTVLSVEGLRARSNTRLWDRACSGISLFAFLSVAAKGDSLTAAVMSDSGARYQVSLSRGKYKTRDHGYVASTCTCPASRDGSMCKHAASFGLHLLGYRPEHEEDLETTPDFPQDAASLVPSLDPEEVIDILIAACAAHPDIAALVQSAQARKGTFDDMLCAARAAVDAVLVGYDYARADRYVGSAVARPLGDMLSAADDHNPNLALGVALAGAYALDERQVHDRYGDLIQVIDEALVTAYRNKDEVTCAQQEMLAAALAGLACRTGTDSLDALFGIEYYDQTECAVLLPELVGAAGLSYIRRLQRHFLDTAERADKPVASTLVARTRQDQLSAATKMAERCQVLLDLLTP